MPIRFPLEIKKWGLSHMILTWGSQGYIDLWTLEFDSISSLSLMNVNIHQSIIGICANK